MRPTKEEVAAAAGKTIEDVIAPGLDVLFCGINPGLYSGATGHHFARPGNRFWPALHSAGFTSTLLQPHEQEQLLTYKLGVTNIVRRATATAAELTDDELRAGGEALRAKVTHYHPRVVAVLGVSAFHVAFAARKTLVGAQDETLGPARVWVLPNPSGLNAHYQLPQLTEQFAALRRTVV